MDPPPRNSVLPGRGLFPEGNLVATPVPDLLAYHTTTPRGLSATMQPPGICVVLQGTKETVLGESRLRISEGQFVCYTVDLPLRAQVTGASADRPYTSLTLLLDGDLLARAAVDAPRPLPRSTEPSPGAGTMTEGLSDAFARLARLLEAPEDIKALAPLVKQEIYYRVLLTPQGAALREAVTGHVPAQQVAASITWLRQHYTEPLDIGWLASTAGMSRSSFYEHFRRATSMSPLQYQKALRLMEARRLIHQRGTPIRLVAHRVGYESASQFSREYKRYFAVSPRQERAKS